MPDNNNNQMQFVDSSFISGAGWFTYDDGSEWLRVRYKKDGAEVEYKAPRMEYDAMMADLRPGQYFRTNIYKAGYEWRRV